jgi:hypothetical protein
MLTTEKVARGRPEAIRGYLRALRKAYEHDADSRHWAENDAHQAKWAPESVQDRAYLKALREFTHARTERDRARGWRWGSTFPDRIEKAQDFLFDLKVIEKKTPVKAMYTDEFLPQ